MADGIELYTFQEPTSNFRPQNPAAGSRPFDLSDLHGRFFFISRLGRLFGIFSIEISARNSILDGFLPGYIFYSLSCFFS